MRPNQTTKPAPRELTHSLPLVSALGLPIHVAASWLARFSSGLRMKLLLAVLALISAGPAAADCPKAADWARAFYSEHYFFYAGAPDPILQFTTPEFGTLLKKEWAYSKGEAQARTRVLAPSRFHHSARRIAVICVLSRAALNENKNVHSRVARDHCALSVHARSRELSRRNRSWPKSRV